MPAESAESEALRRLARRCLGAEVEAIEPLRSGLGLRRFYRLHLAGAGPARAVARVEAPDDPAGRPAGVPPEPSLEPLRTRLEAAGLPVPERLGGDPEAGVDLLEDVGDLSLGAAAAAAPAPERRALYAEACALVPRLQRVADPGDLPAFRRRLDAALFRHKAELFARWSLPAALGREPGAAETAVVEEAFALVAEESAAAPQRLAHRDFQSANLHVRGGAPAGQRLVMLDLQGALLAPPEYDLVCLLRDSYVELPEAEVETHLEVVRPLLPDAPDPDALARRFDLLTLTRKGKDHARFLYAAATRRDRRYLHCAPTTVRALRRAARRVGGLDPRLARLADLIEALPEAA
jgi:aminoglycoside/choline kinase family phosphotransferase